MKLWLIALAVFLTACGASQSQIETAIAQTEAAQPTATMQPTATPIPLSELDLSDVLIQDNDLPAGFVESQISDQPGEAYSDMPAPDAYIGQTIAREDEFAGRVSIWLYESSEDVDMAIEFLLDRDFAYEPITIDLGDFGIAGEPGPEDTAMADTLGIDLPSSVVFRRCGAVISTFIFDTYYQQVETYARRLDSRLEPLVCR